MNINKYKQVYDDIESEIINNIAFYISLYEDQKKVYSTKIAELQLRIYTQIEFLLKEIYYDICKDPVEDPSYDYDCLKYIKLNNSNSLISNDENNNEGYKLNQLAYIHWDLFHLENKLYQPFEMNVAKIKNIDDNDQPITDDNKKTYKWNNAYQNLRHNFGKSIRYFGTIEYLFESLAVFTLLLGQNSKIFTIVQYIDDQKNEISGWVPSRGFIRKSWSLNNAGAHNNEN
ncbi:MAG: hypothetical protein LBM09_00975 [Candidatus Nomurabacteria bacterium]|jgi:hypothetical protein|nr:hypothetical protein [Candidatus Nomurabacteria bacterium]